MTDHVELYEQATAQFLMHSRVMGGGGGGGEWIETFQNSLSPSEQKSVCKTVADSKYADYFYILHIFKWILTNI